MPIASWIENGIIFREMTGEVVIEEILDALKAIPDHPDFQKRMPSIWDMREASLVKVSKDDLYRMQSFISSNAERRGIHFKVAYVASRDLEYGLSRMLIFILETKPTCSRRTFRSMDEAIEWVKVSLENDWKENE